MLSDHSSPAGLVLPEEVAAKHNENQNSGVSPSNGESCGGFQRWHEGPEQSRRIRSRGRTEERIQVVVGYTVTSTLYDRMFPEPQGRTSQRV